MKGVLHLQLWNPPPPPPRPRFHRVSPPTTLSSLSFTLPQTQSIPFNFKLSSSISASETQELSGRERRRLRNERRESKNWREEVEERFIKKKPKKEYKSWTEELNLDNLIKLGPQWWVVRVSRVKGQYTAQVLARSLALNFPDMDFKVYAPAIHEKRRLKNGSYSVKQKPLFPGCIFLRCVLNKPLHDFIREYDGVGGFIGSKVGNTKRQINKPRPVSEDDMEAVFKQAKEKQDEADKAFEEEEKKAVLKSGNPNTELDPDASKAIVDSKPKRGSRQTSNQLTVTDASSPKVNYKLLVKGSTVRIISGTFSGFTGTLKKLSRKTKIATVHFTLFGKENVVDLDVSEIAPETN